MFSRNKTVRYYYWIITAFIRKNTKIMVLSAVVSVILIVGIISLFPYIVGYTGMKTSTIGMVGSYSQNTLPAELTNKISNGLVRVSDSGEIEPVLSERFTIGNNGKAYRFYLKQPLVWNSGAPFTAYDVTYSFQDVEMEVLDEKTIEFRLKEPLPIFPSYLVQPIIRQPLEGVSGLYRVDRIKMKYDTVEEIVLIPNKEGLQSYTYRFYPDESSLLNAYKLGEITEFTITKKSIADSLKSWKNTTVTQAVDYSLLMTLFFNMKNELLGNSKELREAIAMAIDRSSFNEDGVGAVGPIPPISWGYDTTLKNPAHNEDLAKRIIANTQDSSSEATLQISTSFEYTESAEKIKQYLEETGLSVSVQTVGLTDLSSYDMLLTFWKVPTDPDQYYFWHSTQSQGNVTNYQNVKIDKLLEDGRNTADLKKRRDAYLQFQRVLEDDLPAVFLYYPYSYTIKRK